MLQLKLTHDTTAITSFARNTDSAKDGFCAHTKDSQLRLRNTMSFGKRIVGATKDNT